MMFIGESLDREEKFAPSFNPSCKEKTKQSFSSFSTELRFLDAGGDSCRSIAFVSLGPAGEKSSTPSRSKEKLSCHLGKRFRA